MGAKEHIEILAKSSSSATPYVVRCYLEENKISAFCSCRAGDNRMLCKHVRRVMAGDESILYDRRQKNELEKIRNHLKDTQIPLLLSEMEEADEVLEKAKRKRDKAKRVLEAMVLDKFKQ